MALFRCGSGAATVGEVVAGVDNPTFGTMTLSFTTTKAYDKLIITVAAFNTTDASSELTATVNGSSVTLNKLTSYCGSHSQNHFKTYELENVPNGASVVLATSGGVNEHSILLAIA